MADYSLNEWWQMRHSPVDNPLPALQLGASIVQHRAQQDLQERELGNQIARTSLMREEMLAKQKIQTQLTAGNAAVASALSNVTDFDDDEQWAGLMSTFAENPMTVGGKAYLGAMHLRESTRKAKMQEEEARSRINARNKQSEMASQMGWVYPEDGSPPFLVDAKGGTHFAPFHAGLDSGFTPEKTTIGNTELVRTSPNRWQVINKGIPSGKMTDLEKANLSDIRKRRQALVDGLPDDIPKSGFFGGNKSEVDKYSSQTNQISELTGKESSLIQAIEARDSRPQVQRPGLKTENRTTNAPPAVIAPNNDARAQEIKDSFKAGKLTKEEALQQLRELGFK